MSKQALTALAAFIAGFAIFFLLRPLGLPGGDTEVALSEMWRGMLWSDSFTWYLREPFSHLAVWSLFQLTGGQLILAFHLVGALSGGAFLALLTWFNPRPAFWLLCLCSATTWVFVGHIEFYAPYVVALALYYMTVVRALAPEPRATPIHAAGAFVLAYYFHKMTLFFLPLMFWVAFTRADARWVKRPWKKGHWEWALVIFIAGLLLDMVPGMLNNYARSCFPITYISLNERFIDLLTPLTPAMARHFESTSETGMWYVYSFGQPKHWAYFFSFLALGAPLGLPIVLRRWREAVATDAGRALLTAGVIGIGWIFMWQPRGLWKDWDLFCLYGLPFNMLAGMLQTGMLKPHATKNRP